MCKDCVYYDDSLSYKGTGYCIVFYNYVSENAECEDFKEE